MDELKAIYEEFLSRLKDYFDANNTLTNRKALTQKLKWLITYISISSNREHLHNRAVPDLKRGNIVLVQIGDNFGMEFSGKHYAIVLRDCPQDQDLVFVLPITSKKPPFFSKNKPGIYIEFPPQSNLTGFCDPKIPEHSDTGKHWANILNIRNISKSRIEYPTKIRSIGNSQLHKISKSIIANVALRKDLI